MRPPNAGKAKRHNVPLTNGFRRFYNKTCKEALSSDSPLASLIKKEFMMGHKGMISLDQNYFKTSVLELAQEYIGVVPDLSIEDSVRLKRSNTQMSANIRVLEDRDAKITSLEKKVSEMEDMRVGMLDMDRRLKESDGMGAVREDVDSLKSLIKTLEKIHRDNIAEVRADQSKAMGDLKAAKDREISELKDMIATLAERGRRQEPVVQIRREGQTQDSRLAERLQCLVDMIANWKGCVLIVRHFRFHGALFQMTSRLQKRCSLPKDRSSVLDVQIHDILPVLSFDELESLLLVPLHDVSVRMQGDHPAAYLFGKVCRRFDRPRNHGRPYSPALVVFMRCNLAYQQGRDRAVRELFPGVILDVLPVDRVHGQRDIP